MDLNEYDFAALRQQAGNSNIRFTTPPLKKKWYGQIHSYA